MTDAGTANAPEHESAKPNPPLDWPRPTLRPLPPQSVQRPDEQGQNAQGPAESHEQLAHDARNLLAAMGLYCDLLAQPGVLNRRYAHYAGHLRIVVDSGISLVGRLAGPLSQPAGGTLPGQALEASTAATPDNARIGSQPWSALKRAGIGSPRGFPSSGSTSTWIDLGAAIECRRGMLSVLLGARIAFEIECQPCSGLVPLEPIDLDRILINLLRNAGESMPNGGRVRISVQRGGGESFLPTSVSPAVSGVLPYVGHYAGCDLVDDVANDPVNDPALAAPSSGLLGPRAGETTRRGPKTVLLCVQDNGPGIAPEFLGQIFDTGFSTKPLRHPGEEGPLSMGGPAFGTAPSSRGFGLGIVRSLVEAAGGQIRVVSRLGAGTRFEIELPLLCDVTNGEQHPAADAVGRERVTMPCDADQKGARVRSTHIRSAHNRSTHNGSSHHGSSHHGSSQDNSTHSKSTLDRLSNDRSSHHSHSTADDEQEGSRVQC